MLLVKAAEAFPHAKFYSLTTEYTNSEISSVRWIFERGRGGGGGQARSQKLGKGDKKLDEKDEEQKKKVITQIQYVFLPRFSAQILKGGGAWLNFADYSKVFIYYWRPKGGGMSQCPLKYAPE